MADRFAHDQNRGALILAAPLPLPLPEQFIKLPHKKKFVTVQHLAEQNQHCCIECGRVFPSRRSLGSHKAYHTKQRAKARLVQGDAGRSAAPNGAGEGGAAAPPALPWYGRN